MSVTSPVAEVLVPPRPGGSISTGDAAGVERDVRALVWPEMCCCCGSTTDLDSIPIYSESRFGPKLATIPIPYCRRCKSHHRRPGQRAFESAAAVIVIGFTILLVSFLFGILDDLSGFFLQLLVVAGSVVCGGATYFVARAKIQNGITPACTGAERAAVLFLTAESSGWRFRFRSRAYAEQFAAANPRGSLTAL